MKEVKRFLALDLGAESGRAALGELDDHKLKLADIHRFPTGGSRITGTLYWDALRLFDECKIGISKAVTAHGGDISGIGIDTWGVDFGLLGRGDQLLGNPRHYRDHANDGMLEKAFAIVPPERIFNRTGIQFMQINTLYQLLSMKLNQSPLLEQAETLLFMPDLLQFWMTGVKSSEFSIASTGQVVDPSAHTWALDIIEEMHLPSKIFTHIHDAGNRVGVLLPDISSECGCGKIPVIAAGEHDTASAVAAVPSISPDYAYISSGTWSLMGIETQAPVISDQTRNANFTNEGGVCGTIRLLKNIMGLWLVQECRRSFARKGDNYSYGELTQLAELSIPFGPIINPDDSSFLSPENMTLAIAKYCTQTGQTTPVSVGSIIRCCLESLALRYRWTLEKLEEFRGSRIERIHIVGGGSQNTLLCQLAADATRREVVAGPVEATAIGNILMQAIGTGVLGSLAEARLLVRDSFPLLTYHPCSEASRWEEAYSSFLKLIE